MKKEYIVFVDSGVGGLSTLCECYKSNSGKYLYYADNQNCPYGSKSSSQIRRILLEILENLQKKIKVKSAVLACNTATTTSIEFLRRAHGKIKFIGTEPAVKLACKMGSKRIAVLLTPSTAKQKKYKNLVKSQNGKVKTIPCPTLAWRIENSLTNDTLCNDFLLAKTIYKLKSSLKNCDAVVLGCTHYALVRDKFREILSKPTVDGNSGVSKCLSAFLKKSNDDLKSDKSSRIKSCSFCHLHQNFDKNMHNFPSKTKLMPFCHAQNISAKKLRAVEFSNQNIRCIFAAKFSAPCSVKKSVKFCFSKTELRIKEKYIKIFKQTLAKYKNLC